MKASLKDHYARRPAKHIGPTKRPVCEVAEPDTLMPAKFPPLDFAAIEDQATAECDRLLAANAVDGAHGSVLDALVAESFAGVYEQTLIKFNEGLRVMQILDQQLVEACSKAFAKAETLSAAAKTNERVADVVYGKYVGIPRVKTGRESTVDWETEEERWRGHRLLLEADIGILDYVRRGFRGTGFTPTMPIDRDQGSTSQVSEELEVEEEEPSPNGNGHPDSAATQTDLIQIDQPTQKG
jgi:hypothetical protein